MSALTAQPPRREPRSILPWLATPALVVFVGFAVIPLVGVFALSFTTWDGIGAIRPSGLTSWRAVLTNPGLLPETLRERVQASVVLSEAIDLGNRRTARVVVRENLTTRTLLSQVLLGPGVRSTDPGVSEQVQAGLARVREQVGLS